MPVLDRHRVADASSLTDQNCLVHQLEAPLEEVARTQPVLVCIDDAQWADTGTTSALRVLTHRLSHLPIVWMIAFRPRATSPRLIDLVAHLNAADTEALALGPLDDSAIAQLAADIVPAEPTTELLQFVGRAGGSPALLVELLHGLVDEGLVRMDSGRAELLEARIPRRLGDTTRDRLARVSALARQMVTVASILGTHVSFDHVAAMLDLSPASLLGPVEELVLDEMLVDSGRRLGFPNDLTRLAVIETVPPSVRHALQRQAIDVLLHAGVSPVQPAADLAATAQAGDRAVIATLMAASRALGFSDPDVAADLGRRAFDLTATGDDIRGPVVADTARLLHAAGRADEGKELADIALRERLAPACEAEVRLSIARMSDLAPEVRVAASRGALALPGLPIALRARHMSEQVANTLASGRPDVSKHMLAEVEATVGASDDWSATLTLETAKARLAYTDGAFAGRTANARCSRRARIR